MADSFNKEKRSEIMKAVRSSDTKLEKKLAQELWKSGIRYRKNVKDLKGKPDFARIWEYEMKTNFKETSDRVLAAIKENMK